MNEEASDALLSAAWSALFTLEFYVRREFAGTYVFAEKMAELDPLRKAIEQASK